jgi:hypothetical protein
VAWKRVAIADAEFARLFDEIEAGVQVLAEALGLQEKS